MSVVATGNVPISLINGQGLMYVDQSLTKNIISMRKLVDCGFTISSSSKDILLWDGYDVNVANGVTLPSVQRESATITIVVERSCPVHNCHDVP
jgi:hypothetical protein